MGDSFDMYRFVKKILIVFILLTVIVLSLYNSYVYVSNLFVLNQIQTVDPLENLSNAPRQIETIDSFISLQSQVEVPEVQKNNILGIIKANKKISEAEKIKIMRELGGNIK